MEPGGSVPATKSGGELNEWGRNETKDERADRKWSDLIQEVRVAQTGVQILFGFLLTVVFQQKYATLEDTDKTIYIVTVVLGAATTGALIGPVSLHRVVAGRRIKTEAVEWASRMTFVGLVLLLATMSSSLLLVLRVATHNAAVPWIVTGVVAWYLLCWVVVPLWTLHRHTE
ncbi:MULTISPECIES: DUF6328 family protein [unclassified Streptomyces]|uniref:DUF6328 family protein n=1 Tax=unclassified Streptomyces TaxID=2593676 RepID=UPI00224D473F|nr:MULTISPECIES: DUF6328 family protein [unclassified Streptomyces]MCX4878522.1 DUF6328 family protein [Streptomyces sp. NBC_00847]MCX5054968.1 DUF6328 family protein [Streptomyces sp. NBC_00474]MCX5252389.1 DUF6328 family protein [Streptomyces sp. NBC_00201]MCX5290742.1 DUF6328 family protein [Streptomyces sp. NBC_00183]